MNLTTAIIVALATWQAVEIWHHSYLFAGWRARVEIWENAFGDLLGCPFCLAPWVAFILLVLLTVSSEPTGDGYIRWHWGIDLIVMALAASRLANIGNDLIGRRCRTPKADQLPETDNDEPDDPTLQ